MARFRRKSCAASLALVLLVLIVTIALKSLAPEDTSFTDGKEPSLRRKDDAGVTAGMSEAARLGRDGASAAAALSKFPPPNYFLHAFYYIWYGNPGFDSKYIHWDHPQLPHWDPKVAERYPRGRRSPPDDIAANFYPALGAYSSRDPAVVEAHMQQLRTAAIGVVAVSWYPPGTKDDNGEPVDDIVPLLLDAAQRYAIKVAFHIEPYKGRDEVNMYANIKYIIDSYGEHPAFFRYRTDTGKPLPLFYVYDSYLLNTDHWARLLRRTEGGGGGGVRDTPYDAVFLALLVEEKQQREVLRAGFDGVYTYFATNGFTYGATLRNWRAVRAFCDDNGLLFVPSVGPGYVDTNVRPWNFQNTRNRINGKYYETSLGAALDAKPDLVSVTSFNEWHEGTQIEMAVPKSGPALYLDYLPNKPAIYLEITRKWAAMFDSERRRRRD
ncbi:glycoprotein endo-alpha-1,2-mannosidase [Syngnathoides biaculeatus]|uniref:glycoprotein endo-alpha-1,2-mannosidase n=1 Tax=Syngnathoides biaculeatus TaxID=300417 RepID=UPI002ADE1D7D|nr:glycoprotein endo-alpha-1,2-mannosidase [Syngnathoides biaculeatus]XP_061700668.1 glycoprotein endo-alpha-1,2-mannosidase [Syngnathoides biaculeatus]